jgi:LytTR family transcriptional regulator, CO-responsive transcriptional regulator RcoM
MKQQQYILNRLPVGLVMLDSECRVTSYSDTAASTFGVERMQEALGRTIQSLHPDHSRSKIEWLLQQARDDDALEYASMLINVPDTILQLRVVQLRSGSRIEGYCLVLYDITELTSHPSTKTSDEDGQLSAGRSFFKLPVSVRGKIALLDISCVAFLHADGHHTQVHAEGKNHFCSLSLSQLESRLPQDRFVRVHRSYVVNLAHANAVLRQDDQFVLAMEGNVEIPISRSNAPRLRSLLGV